MAKDRYPGTAVVQIADREYVIPVECYDPARPELGFTTEPSRITKERTGRSNPIRISIRPWKETTELVVSLDRYVAWIPAQSSSGGVMSLRIDLSPASSVLDGIPVTMTYDRWNSGERPSGLKNVLIKVTCGAFDPEAPSSRKIQKSATEE